jgi:hypothetical protein
MQFSQDHLQRLTAQRVDAFARHLARRAAQRHGSARQLPVDDLTRKMRDEITHARGAGLADRDTLERWSDLACVLGFGFSRQLPWAAQVLAAGRPPVQALRLLEEGTVFATRTAPR